MHGGIPPSFQEVGKWATSLTVLTPYSKWTPGCRFTKGCDYSQVFLIHDLPLNYRTINRNYLWNAAQNSWATLAEQSVLIERVATLGSKVSQKSSTLSSITKEFQKIVPMCLYMVCKHWSSHVRRSYRKLGVFAVQKTRKLGMCCVKCNTFERLSEAIMTSTMIPLLYTHIKLRGYAFRCAKIWWYFAHFLHTHAQSVRTQQWLIVDVIIASIVYRDRWWGGTLLSNWPISAYFRCRNSLYQYTLHWR